MEHDGYVVAVLSRAAGLGVVGVVAVMTVSCSSDEAVPVPVSVEAVSRSTVVEVTSPPVSTMESVSTTSVDVGGAVEETRVVDAIGGLQPGEVVGFAPEVVAEVDDVVSILPVGSELSVVPGSVVVEGDTAMADVVLELADGSVERHWVFLERRDGVWLVTLTLLLPEM